MRLVLVSLLALVPVLSQAHREHGAHEHGHGDLAIAFDGNNGRVELKAPSESIYGFEHAAKTDKQKKQIDDAFAKLESKIGEMVAFDPELKCAFTKDGIEIVRENDKSSHSEVRAAFKVACEKSPLGRSLTLDVAKQFPKLRHTQVTVLTDSVQKSAELGKKSLTIELKP
ncbi:MAG: DUF2796 domain-containing protein [Bdellovibrionaceae bacterium]|nr:DUF2796 domain-containing protein [Pseudobdellovibrionaceae bacterium]MBX3034850.1 DUF2796 domain-containing protein [Pseudobdellovibrionaceae bacterium]